MKKYIITSDKFLPLLKGQAYFFNKYWSPDEEVVVLCYKKPKFSLPDNFIIHSLGNQQNYGKYWTNALIPYFNSIKEHYFMIILDDLLLLKPVDIKTLEKMEDLIKYKFVDKAVLSNIVGEREYITKNTISNNIVEINKSTERAINHKTTLQPAIWNKKYFLQYLKPNYTAWDFEVKNQKIAKIDNDVVIGPVNKKVYFKLNLILKDNINYKDFNNNILNDEDKRVMMGLIKKWK